MQIKLNVKVAGKVKNFAPEEFIDAKEAKDGTLYPFGIAASKMAIKDGGIEIGKQVNPERVGVWIGSGIGGLDVLKNSINVF